MAVRAKFKCMNKYENPHSEGQIIILEPVISGSPENESFYKYTPWGEIKLGTINEKAAEQFEVGKEYYVDFIAVE